jgi:hypothetical protein
LNPFLSLSHIVLGPYRARAVTLKLAAPFQKIACYILNADIDALLHIPMNMVDFATDRRRIRASFTLPHVR